MTDMICASRAHPRLVMPYVLACWSGAYVMLFEMLGARLLAPWFGNSIHVWGAVIFTFMLALSLGYLLGGALARGRVTVTRLALLLVAGALATLPLILLGDRVLGYLFDMAVDPRYGSLAAALLLFLPPTLLFGAVSPYAVALLASSRGRVGSIVGYLTFWSTLGSSLGTLLTAFYLVLWFEVHVIFYGALGLTLVIAAMTILYHRYRR